MKLKYDIFISYRRSGGTAYARTLKSALENKGYSVFLDLDELKDGHFRDVIYKALDASGAIFLLLTSDIFERCSTKDDHVRNEIEYALENGLNIIPIVIDKLIPEYPGTLPDSIKKGISAIQYSFLDTEHLFNESLEKILTNRVEPRISRNKRKRRRKRVLAYIASILGIIALSFGGVKYYRWSHDPWELLVLADKLARTEMEPKTISQVMDENGNLRSKHIFALYRKGAELFEKKGTAEFDQYSQTRDFNYLSEAQDCFHNSAYGYHCLEEYGKAIENYKMAISCGMKAYEISGDFVYDEYVAYSMNSMAYCYEASGNLKDALLSVESALEIIPSDINLMDSKGELYYKAEEYSKAIEVWEEIHRSDPYFKPNYWVKECIDILGSEKSPDL